MEYTDIAVLLREPIVWLITIIGAFLLNIMSNIVTPYVPQYWKSYRLRSNHKQIELGLLSRQRVINLQENHNHRMSEMSHAIYLQQYAQSQQLLSIFCLALAMPFGFENSAFMAFPAVLFYVIGMVFSGRASMRHESARTADEREQSLDFWKKSLEHQPTQDEIRKFLDKWDTERFGVSSKDALEHDA